MRSLYQESCSYQDSANAHANDYGYGYGSLYKYTGLGPSRYQSINQVIQASKVTETDGR